MVGVLLYYRDPKGTDANMMLSSGHDKAKKASLRHWGLRDGRKVSYDMKPWPVTHLD